MHERVMAELSSVEKIYDFVANALLAAVDEPWSAAWPIWMSIVSTTQSRKPSRSCRRS
jgi:hypothetical protein